MRILRVKILKRFHELREAVLKLLVGLPVFRGDDHLIARVVITLECVVIRQLTVDADDGHAGSKH